MYDVPDKLSSEIYLYDKHLISIAKSLLTSHMLKSPPADDLLPLMDLIRYNAVNEIQEDSPSALGEYLEQAIHYTYTNVHALGIFIIGHTKLETTTPSVADNLSSWKFFPTRYVETAANLLVRAAGDYMINISVLLKEPRQYKEKLFFTALWIASDCQKDLSEEIDERTFLSLFYDKAYSFSEFLATYYSILSGKPVRHRKGVPRTPQLEILDCLLDK